MNPFGYNPWARSLPSVVAGTPNSHPRADRFHRIHCLVFSNHCHQSVSTLFCSSIPKISETFFCSSTIPSARSALHFSRALSRSNSRTLSANGFFSRRCGPRCFPFSPANSPFSRCLRHVLKFDQYKPSRRKSAPISPGRLQRSASRNTFALYSPVNRRRSPFDTTSTSVKDFKPLRPVSTFRSLLALYTKLLAGNCLIHIGREGMLRFAQHDIDEGSVYCNIASQRERENLLRIRAKSSSLKELQAQIPPLDLLVLPQVLRRRGVHDTAAREHVNVVRDAERERQVLLDEEDR